MKNLILELISRIFNSIYGHTIILEDVNGFTGNAGAVYEYMLNDHRFDKYSFVWLVKELNSYNALKRKRTKVYLFTSKSILKRLIRFSADYILYDNLDIKKKRKSQILICLTHGTPPLKNVKGIINMPNDLDYVICGSKNSIELISNQYSVDKSKIVVFGQPRNDYLYKIDKATQKFVDEFQGKIIIWAPTFRKTRYFDRNDSNKEYRYGIPLMETERDYEKISEFLKKNNITLIIKLHPSADLETLAIKSNSNIKLFSQDDLDNMKVDFYSLLGASDALITDYSSISFDYLLLDRPIGYIIDDIKEFKLGFSYKDYLSMMPGTKIKTIDEMIGFMSDVINEKDPFKSERIKIRNLTNDYIGQENCKKIVDFLLLEEK